MLVVADHLGRGAVSYWEYGNVFSGELESEGDTSSGGFFLKQKSEMWPLGRDFVSSWN